jgi:hypothetical protein
MSAPDSRCPLLDESIPVLSLSRNRNRIGRHPLHRRSACEMCAAGYTPDACPLRNNFTTQLQVAIQEVLSEYQ